MTKKLRIAVSASGSGTCFQSVIDHIHNGSLDAEIILLTSDVPDCIAIQRANDNQIPVLTREFPKIRKKLPKAEGYTIPEKKTAARTIHEHRLLYGCNNIPGLLKLKPDIFLMVGDMRIKTDFFTAPLTRQGTIILNTHPAPIPEYRGENGYEWGAGEDIESIKKNEWHCVTFHQVIDAGVDMGPIISQYPFVVNPTDTSDDLKKKGMNLEYLQINQCLQWFAEERIKIINKNPTVIGTDKIAYEDALGCVNIEKIIQTINRQESLIFKVEQIGDRYNQKDHNLANFNIEIINAENETYTLRPTELQSMPYNLGFTYAFRKVKELRNLGYTVNFIFDNINIHPVFMNSDLTNN